MNNSSLLAKIIHGLISFALIAATVWFVITYMRPVEVQHGNKTPLAINTVQVVPVEPHTSGIDFKVDGQVVPYRSIDIAPEVSGIVITKSEQARSGCFVHKGDLLFEIEPKDFELEVQRSNEAVDQAEVEISEVKVQIANTQSEIEISKKQLEIKIRDLDRYEKANEGVYSASEIDTARTTVLSFQESLTKLNNQLRLYNAQLARYEASLSQAKISVELANLNLRRTRITAPIDGVITSNTIETNSFVQKGTVCVTLQDTSKLEIQCFLHMKQMSWLWYSPNDEKIGLTAAASPSREARGYEIPPTDATVYYELEGSRWSWTGKLTTSDSGSLDVKTRMMLCRVTIEDPSTATFASTIKKRKETALGTPITDDFNTHDSNTHDSNTDNSPANDGFNKNNPSNNNSSKRNEPLFQSAPPTLLSGMYVTIIVHAKPVVPLYRVPEQALLPGNRIWTATDGVLRQYEIRVAATTPQGVLFYAQPEGVQPKDQVVVSPLASPTEGSKVNLL